MMQKTFEEMTPEERHTFNTRIEEDCLQDLRKYDLEKAEEDAKRHERLTDLIDAVDSEKPLILDIRGYEIQIVKSLNRDLRRKIINVEKAQDGIEDIDGVEDMMYSLMADICIDDQPERHTDPEFWKMVETETGQMPRILGQAVKMINEEFKAMRGFRKGRGPDTRGDVQDGGGIKKP